MAAPATPPPPEATLIRLVREAAGLSPETAAARMEVTFSGSRWRQIERGWRGDSRTKVIAPPVTLAQMCRALGISSERLTETGRDDAVEILREMERSKAPATEEITAPSALEELKEWQQALILKALDDKPRRAREKALLLRTLAAKIEEIEAQEAEGEAAAEPSAPTGPTVTPG